MGKRLNVVLGASVVLFIFGVAFGKDRIQAGAEGLGTVGTAGLTPLAQSLTEVYRGVLPFKEISEELDPFFVTVFKPFNELLDLRDRI